MRMYGPGTLALLLASPSAAHAEAPSEAQELVYAVDPPAAAVASYDALIRRLAAFGLQHSHVRMPFAGGLSVRIGKADAEAFERVRPHLTRPGHLHFEPRDAPGPGLAIEAIASARSSEGGVTVTLSPNDAARFREFTERHIGHHIAVMVDGTSYACPRVLDAISSRVLQIDTRDASILAAILASGPLPATLRQPEVNTTEKPEPGEAAPPCFSTLDRMDARTRFIVEYGQHFVDDSPAGEISAYRVALAAQYAGDDLGVYGHLSSAGATVDFHDDGLFGDAGDTLDSTDHGAFEVGAYRLLGGEAARVVLRGGLSLPTASNGFDSLHAKTTTLYQRLVDLADLVGSAWAIRGSVSLLHDDRRVHFRGDFGLDAVSPTDDERDSRALGHLGFGLAVTPAAGPFSVGLGA